MDIKKKIKDHYKNQKFARITRRISKFDKEISRGYIVGKSDDFIILQAVEDFLLSGFSILPIRQIKKIRYNNFDEYYDKIVGWEKFKKKLKFKKNINLESWATILEFFKKEQKNIIIECEHYKHNLFLIGSIKKVTKKSVYIHYFNAEGVFDKKLTKVNFKDITSVTFDDRYIDVFSKYTRKSKKRTSS